MADETPNVREVQEAKGVRGSTPGVPAINPGVQGSNSGALPVQGTNAGARPSQGVPPSPGIPLAPGAPLVKYEDFAKLDLRVATILSAEKVEGADKLLKLRIRMGPEERTLAAGIAKNYLPEELPGKKIIVIANLEPRKIRGIESQGMLLAAVSKDDAGNETGLSLVSPGRDLPDGSKIF